MRSFAIASSLLLGLLAGCATTHHAHPDDDDGGAPPPDASTDAMDLADAPIADDAPSDAHVVEACPTGVPSRQTVRFHVSGTGYLVTSGTDCGAFEVARLEGDSIDQLQLGLGYQCICECPAPPPARANGYAALDPSSTVDLTWDARSLTTCSESVDCAERGWPGGPITTVLHGVPSPVTSGTYYATLLIADEPPADCLEGEPGRFMCPFYGDFMPGPSWGSFSLCDAPRSVTVTFELPATGDVDVDVNVD